MRMPAYDQIRALFKEEVGHAFLDAVRRCHVLYTPVDTDGDDVGIERTCGGHVRREQVVVGNHVEGHVFGVENVDRIGVIAYRDAVGAVGIIQESKAYSVYLPDKDTAVLIALGLAAIGSNVVKPYGVKYVQRTYETGQVAVHCVIAGHVYEVEAHILERIREAVR